MQVIASDAHRSHAPRTEGSNGEAIAAFEVPERAERIRGALASDARFAFVEPKAFGTAAIEAIHEPGLVSFLETAWAEIAAAYPGRRQAVADTYANPKLREGMGPMPEPSYAMGRLGFWGVDTATPITEGTYPAARAAVDIALTTTELVLGGESVAYGLCRPPGHHAPKAAFAGYCYFNNAAIAAQRAVSRGAKVTILDVDYHHGNGTQQIFYDRDDVQYVSLHGDPMRAYPYFVGYADETGTGPGLGANLNIPLERDCDDETYAAALSFALESIDRFGPSLVVVSLGVDTYQDDPITDLAITTDGFAAQGRLISELARPMVVLQEGGYDIDTVGRNVVAFLGGLLGD